MVTLLCIGLFFFSLKTLKRAASVFLSCMLTKSGNPLIWDAHLLKEVMKSNHLLKSIESQTNHFWSPPSSFRSFGVHMASDCQKNLPWTLGGGGGTRQPEGRKGTHTISSRNTHLSAKLPPPILWSLYAPNYNPKPNLNNFSSKNLNRAITPIIKHTPSANAWIV